MEEDRSAAQSRPGSSWTNGDKALRGVVGIAVLVVALVATVIVLRASGDDAQSLIPAIEAVNRTLSSADELVGDERPELGLDERFTELRAWRDGEAVVGAWARAGNELDAERVRSDGVISAALIGAAATGATVLEDDLASTDPLVRVVVLQLDGGTIIVNATATTADGAVVLTVSASGRDRPTTDVVGLALAGLAAVG